MPTFRGSDFLVELPDGFRDESTYAFTLPTRSKFQPSVVVKTERLAAPQPLPEYVKHQLDKIRQVLPEFTPIRSQPAQHGKLPAYSATYEWGPPTQRVRQKQLYILLEEPARVVSLTSTHLSELFDQAEPLTDAIFRSFSPQPSQKPPV